ncbi:hypothetical protein [Aquimarina sp. 2201CG14-23]|uniref:hypothetical protein n=1 Tax=Aquimarina mycalae TaxID=3040073 RepID=UPI00247822CF|nr:hypothetical protein [Aquimarina sp. 2201CG14-23]MDH7445848.1 hypothetical protein [Aquimarina sp. 2201CG14-23]
MKQKIVLIILLAIGTEFSYGQWIHFWLSNTDRRTRTQMGIMNATAATRAAELKFINDDLSSSKKHLRTMLDRYYRNNTFDNKARNDYLKTAFASSVMAGISTVISNSPNAMYMTKNKKEYIDQINLVRGGVLGSIVGTDVFSRTNPTVRSDNRQEIYRLRAELLRKFSENDRELRSLLGVTIAAGIIAGDVDILSEIKKIEIFF